MGLSHRGNQFAILHCDHERGCDILWVFRISFQCNKHVTGRFSCTVHLTKWCEARPHLLNSDTGSPPLLARAKSPGRTLIDVRILAVINGPSSNPELVAPGAQTDPYLNSIRCDPLRPYSAQ